MPTISKTCQSCASSKVKCLRDVQSQQACNRCVRLGRECTYRQTGRRFHGFQKDRHIEALESRIEELMSDRAASSGRASVEALGSTPDSSSIHGAPRVEPDNFGTNFATKDVIGRGLLSLETATRYLDTFKTVLSSHFPFVVIPPSMSVHQLRQTKPFLFLAVLASASYDDLSLQRILGDEVKKAVASRIILGGEVSFDSLQGLLVFLAWSHYHTKPYRYTQFLQLAVSFVIDLRLDRPAQSETWKIPLRFESQDSLNESTQNRPSWGLDEKRALIGCYYLSSSVAIYLQKHSNFSYIPYIEDCCQILQSANEYPSDLYIVHLVALQRIEEKIDRLSTDHSHDMSNPGSGTELYVTSIKSDLRAFQRRALSDMNHSPFLSLHFHATGLCLYQLALNTPNQQTKLSDSGTVTWRDELSSAAIDSAESILNLLVSLPPYMEVGFTNSQWVQLAFGMLVAYRHTVSVFKPAQTKSFLQTLAQIRKRVGDLSTPLVDTNGKRDVFFDFTNKINRVYERVERIDQKEDMGPWDSGSGKPMAASTFEVGAQMPFVAGDTNTMPELFSYPEMDYQFMQGFGLDLSVNEMLNGWF